RVLVMIDDVPVRKRTARLAYRTLVFALVLLLLGLPFRSPARERTATPTPVTVGRKIFHDPSLSASGAMSCATCHDPANGQAPGSGLAVQLGGPRVEVPGFRAVPSLRYLSTTPAFSFDDEGAPNGGFNRDGRARDLMAQALRPLFASHEMANASQADLVAR